MTQLLFKEPAKSFIFYHEERPFSPWHHHPEYELVFIKKGKGKRMVGDHIDRFEENDLVFVGADIPLQVSDLLRITNMWYTAFYNTFKYSYKK